ncbi:hypothetical protein [Streptomyces paludis]|uniref:Uncharacterized protein n=1 Tax=Streptomyces paludis TaxID=2282738 RepID=A0A345HRK9_9ACTN|nr:hypothetical protein [Streptomyces paludis]AXG79333.1 hypothetical protein DVK44_18615 [Streptomyces paludis]
MDTTHTEPQTEPEAELQTEPEHQPAAHPAPRTRRRGRTALLIATAAVLGIVAGTATGYAVQADRDPTPLPVLAQPGGVPYPAKPLAASGGAGAKAAVDPPGTVRDLRKLLIGRPAGSRAHEPESMEDGWMSVAGYAQYFNSPVDTFTWLVGDDVRRIAATSWLEGEHRQVDVMLVEFQPGAYTTVLKEIDTVRSRGYTDVTSGGAAAGSVRGGYYLFEPRQEAGFLPVYQALGYAGRGDVKVEIHLYDSRPIAERDIRKLTERQLERL